MKGIDLLRKKKAEFNILTVINDKTAQHPEEIYSFFLSKGFRYLQFIPCVEVDSDRGKITDYSVGKAQYGDFLCRLFDCWYNDGEPQASIRFFDNVLGIYLGYEPDMCLLKQRCGNYVVVEYNGDVYPCDFMVEKEQLLGNILRQQLSEILTTKKFTTFVESKEKSPAECDHCQWRFTCNKDCPRLRGLPREGKSAYFCQAHKKFFSYSEERFRKLATKFSQGSVAV